MKKDHGDYRACYIAMADDADFHAMTGDAFKLLWVLKLILPTAGIGVVYLSNLADRSGRTVEQVELLLTELATPKPGSDCGWIVRDRNIVWVVNALACEPGMNHKSPNHRTNIRKTVQRLPERSAAVQSFLHYYREWFEPVVKGSDTADDANAGSDEGFRSPSEGVAEPETTQKQSQSQQQSQIQSKGDAVDLELSGARHADDATAANSGAKTATASPAAQESNGNSVAIVPLPTNARRLLRDCYGIKRNVPMTDRQKQVSQDMRATLGERGALLERLTYVRAWSPEHLDAMCEKILADGVNKPDAALRLVLLELRKTWQEWKASAEKAQLGDTTTRSGAASLSPTRIANLVSVPNDAEAAAAETWFASLPADQRKTIESPIDQKCPRNKASAWREQLLRDAVVEAYRKRIDSSSEARVSA